MNVHTTSLEAYPLFRRGKVRDVYDLGDRLLMVATDRISAFDVVMNETIPDKGRLLTAISMYWFDALAGVVPHHVIGTDVAALTELRDHEIEMLQGRSMIVQKTNPLPVECVVRGYLAGSGWKEYVAGQTVCGISLPSGLSESSKLPEPIFTPATKADVGHDENISFEAAARVLGESTADILRKHSIDIYDHARKDAAAKGLILADTKFEFGIAADGGIILIDEVLTPDSSRYWLSSSYAPGTSQYNFDKQILRDWLDATDWNKQYPPPTLPEHVLTGTRDKYIEAYERITGKLWK